MDVHSVGHFENWGFGDFQFLKSNPNEPQQPIETSQLGDRQMTNLGRFCPNVRPDPSKMSECQT
jgi:hypothetical protein